MRARMMTSTSSPMTVLRNHCTPKTPLYLGVRKNEHFELVSKHFVSESIFAWVDPSYLKISDELRADALANRSTWHHYLDGFRVLAMDEVLPLVGRCDA